MFSTQYPPKSLKELGADLRRVALGTAYALRPVRIAVLPRVLVASLRHALRLERPDAALDGDRLPPPAARGFVGVAGSLDPETLMRAFRRGYYPMGHIGPKKWWFNPERMVMPPHRMVREKDVRRAIRNRKFTVAFDAAFTEVMLACGEPRKGQVPLTWITPDIVAAYEALHREGHAHSFEAWNADGELVGGGFGIAVGPVFVIESQFTRERNASKVAMATLLAHLSRWGFALADGKAHTGHLESLGFKTMPHDAFVAVIEAGPREVGAVGKWTVDPSIDPSQDWQPAPAFSPAAPAAASSAAA